MLCHRHPERSWYPNVWDLPGGHINAGEASADSLVRELQEELGIEIDALDAVIVLKHSPQPDLEIEVRAVATWRGHVSNADPAEHDRIGWFSIDQLDNLALADAGVATACRLAIDFYGQPPLEIGTR